MSKFFYSGQIRPVYYLNPRELFIRRYSGKWQILLLQGVIDLVTVLLVPVYFYFRQAIPDTYVDPLVVLIAVNALVNSIICFLSNFFLKSKIQGNYLKLRAIVDLIFAVAIFLLPNLVINLIYYSLLSLIFVVSIQNLFRNRTALKTVFCIAGLAVVVLSFIYGSFIYPYRIYLVYAILGLIGIFYIYVSLKNRKHLSDFDSEQAGFTDYKIY